MHVLRILNFNPIQMFTDQFEEICGFLLSVLLKLGKPLITSLSTARQGFDFSLTVLQFCLLNNF